MVTKTGENTMLEVLIKCILWFVAIGFAYFLMCLILINLAAGCGEVIYHADGTWETGECWLIPYEPTAGEWK